MNKKNLILLAGIGVASAAVVTSGVLYASAKKNQDDKYSGLIQNRVLPVLSDFEFKFKKDQNDYYAGEFVTGSKLLYNGYPSGYPSEYRVYDFWEKVLMKSKENHPAYDFFTLKTQNNQPFNVLSENYSINLESFANDSEGVLLLKVTLVEKNVKEKPKTESYVYQLKGFKKVSEEEKFKYRNVDEDTILKDDILAFNTIEEIKNAYESASSENQADLIKKWFEHRKVSNNDNILEKQASESTLEVSQQVTNLTYKPITVLYDADTSLSGLIKDTDSQLLNKTKNVMISGSVTQELSLKFLEDKKLIEQLSLKGNNKEFSEIKKSELSYSDQTRSYPLLKLTTSEESSSWLNNFVQKWDRLREDAENQKLLFTVTFTPKTFLKNTYYEIKKVFELSVSELKSENAAEGNSQEQPNDSQNNSENRSNQTSAEENSTPETAS
ncbi:MAG1430 family protein [Mycoplasma sp. Ms02]|uniref:MAG1430 family protein n=1 Tax=Mycoplasma sp. Ms02 TaxID=353851 RepID=UPI001C89B67B|nr:lipoprotein 17-related variable surface protein [Mycoplasma sp. Ms02]QZE12265.1 hypothetical protein K4L35_02940 [Mycoplasma sp. Ms02]